MEEERRGNAAITREATSDAVARSEQGNMLGFFALEIYLCHSLFAVAATARERARCARLFLFSLPLPP